MNVPTGVMRWLMACLLAGSGLTATGLFANQASDSEQFLIESELWIDGELQAVPVMVIGLGEPGYLLQTNEEGRVEEGGWRLEFNADLADDPLNLSDALWVDVQLSIFEEGRWEPLLDSMLGVPEGEYSTISISDEGEQPSTEHSEVYLRLRVARLQARDN
ncbi:MAG: hypothetical protein AAGJ52_02605 [Pseudomonadota bacterium]